MGWQTRVLLALMLTATFWHAAMAADPLRLYAAGSLKSALTDGQHAAPGRAHGCRLGRAGRAVRAQSPVRPRATKARPEPGDPAGDDPRPRDPPRHLDAQGRSVRRLCLAGVREGRGAAAGELRDSRRQGAEADRRARLGEGARGPQHLRLGDGRGSGGRVPHLLHQTPCSRAATCRRCRSWACPTSLRSAPTMA
jgi:hypothetical protein